MNLKPALLVGSVDPFAVGEWPLWEVFIRFKQRRAHTHCGSLRAPDAEAAIRIARNAYVGCEDGVSIWVVQSAAITAGSPASTVSDCA